MLHSEFKVGQRIKKLEDEGDGPKWFPGKVTEVTPEFVFLLMDDLDEPIPIPEEEWKDIRLVK